MNKIIAAAIAAAVMMPAASFAADSKPSVKVGGYVQTDYRTGQNGVTDAQQQEFNVRRARVSVSGKVNPMIGFGVQLQGDNSGGTIFRDAFATLEANPLAKLTVGQFKYEFDIEGRESSADRSFMDRAFVVNAMAGGASNDFRDKGAQVSGVMDMGGMGAGYAVGVWNGEGGTSTNNPQSGTNNELKYTANLFISPIKGVKLNGGYMQNKATAGDVDTWTVGLAYDAGPLFARGEYFGGDVSANGVTVTGAAATSLVGADASGWYLLGGFSVTPAVDLMARYQTFELEDVGNSTFSSIDLGAKYFLAKKGKHGGSNIAVNYMIRDADGAAPAQTVLNDGRGTTAIGAAVDNVLAARLQVQF